MIDLRSIKKYALENIPSSMFANTVMTESDQISEVDFRAKLPAWFTILKSKEGAGVPTPTPNTNPSLARGKDSIEK